MATNKKPCHNAEAIHESICLTHSHSRQIKEVLHLDSVSTKCYKTTFGFASSVYNETVPVKLGMDCLFG